VSVVIEIQDNEYPFETVSEGSSKYVLPVDFGKRCSFFTHVTPHLRCFARAYISATA